MSSYSNEWNKNIVFQIMDTFKMTVRFVTNMETKAAVEITRSEMKTF